MQHALQKNISRVVNSQDAMMIAGIPPLLAPNDGNQKSHPESGELQRYALLALAGGGAAALAVATSDVNAEASLTAMSARTLRSSVTPATFNPWINWP